MDVSDSILITGIKQNNYQNYNQLFIKYYSRLCAFIYNITNDVSASEDIVQDLFIKIWEKRNGMVIPENVSAFLYTSAKNAALNFIRSEKTRKKAQEEGKKEELVSNNDFLEHEEFRQLLYDCVSRLPDRSREVFVMSRIEGFKQKEISEKLGTSVKTIKNQLWKSLQYLRSCLENSDAF